MKSVLLDTHTWSWWLTDSRQMPERIFAIIRNADTVLVSPVSFYEIGQKVRLGKWSTMEPYVARLSQHLAADNGRIAELTPEICLAAALLNWTHRDPFDRMLAATALHYRLPLISADAVFDGMGGDGGRVTRVW